MANLCSDVVVCVIIYYLVNDSFLFFFGATLGWALRLIGRAYALVRALRLIGRAYALFRALCLIGRAYALVRALRLIKIKELCSALLKSFSSAQIRELCSRPAKCSALWELAHKMSHSLSTDVV